MPDDHGEVCAGGMFTDRVARLDPKVFEQAANQLL